ncbi:MAG TPA: ATP-binding protein [Bryobacteraceae bacterium]|nr:ATP-binding protein [Bryobacteraceae bacterium]
MRHRAGFWGLLSLVTLLCFLGFLQYRWIDRLAQAEREREILALRTAATRFASAFDVEITRAQIAFGPFPIRFDQGQYLVERARLWSEFAPYPRLVKEVRIAEGDRAFRLTTSGLEPVEGDVPKKSDPLVISSFGRPDGPSGVRTIVFDGEYIRTELLPKLAARFLNIHRYGVLVSAGGEPLYKQSDFQTELTTQMFAFRPECFGGGGGLRGERRPRGGPGGPPDGGPGPGFGMGPPPRGPGGPRGRHPGGPSPGAPPWRDGGAALIARSDVTCLESPPSRNSGRWTLAAGLTPSGASGLHEFRTRSLLLSFGVLAVLGTGIAMLGLYAHRAQVLAQRQMEFAMAVSHELRTPLTVIRVAADNLSEGMVSDPKKYGEMIRRETLRLSDMVEQVLVFARTQRSDIRPNFEPVSPSEVIDRALSVAGPSLEAAGMRVERDVPPDLPAIRADVNLVSAGLQNLLINAAKYAGKGGVVRVRAGREEPSNVSIVVEDDGPGVLPSELDQIFSPFYRGADASNSRVPGLGLGLHLVKRIAESHGGVVRAQNREGRGFLIEMRMPSVES